MIVEIHNGVIYLSGAIRTNAWPTLRSAVEFMLRAHPDSVVIDCSAVASVSDHGVNTFVDAMRHTVDARLPILLSNLPDWLRAELNARLLEPAPWTQPLSPDRLRDTSAAPAWWDKLWGTV